MNKNKKTFYITTPIYYPSGSLHIGHLFSTNLAWVIKNYKTKMNYDVKFLTGSDEHGQKIEKKAKELKMDNQAYVDMQTSKFIDLWNSYQIDYDFFSRTTNNEHKECIIKIFNEMLEKKLIYKGLYKGLYSVEDEEFIPETQAIKKDNNFYHPISNHQLEVIEEESYFFKMKDFTKWISEFFDINPEFIVGQKIMKELKNNFLEHDLNDLSITRISFSWGIPIPSDPKHVVYVWLDALFNYISALGYAQNGKNYIKYWKEGDEIVHVVGKEITRFHCIYWPIFLHSLNLRLPSKILAHGWIITSEGKMSKSKGNVINPLDLLKDFDPEIIKYYFAAKMSIENDNVFEKEFILQTYNSDLVNTIGNLVSRTLAMIHKNFSQSIKFKETNEEHDLFIIKSINHHFDLYINHFDQYNINLAFDAMIELARDLNKYIDLTTPWKLTDNLDRLAIVLNILLNGIYTIAAMLEPVMPNHAKKIQNALNVPSLSFEEIKKMEKFDQILVNKSEIIFPRK